MCRICFFFCFVFFQQKFFPVSFVFFGKLGQWTHFVWMQFTVWSCFSVASFVTSVLTYACWQWYLCICIDHSHVPTELHSLLWLGDRKKQQKQNKKWLSIFFFFFFTESPKYSLMRIDLVSAFLFFLSRPNILGFLNCGWVRKFRDSRILTFIQAREYKHEQQSKNKNDQLLNVNGKFTYYFLVTQCSKIWKKWLGRISQEQDVNIRHGLNLNVPRGPTEELNCIIQRHKGGWVSNDNNICVERCQNIKNNMLQTNIQHIIYAAVTHRWMPPLLPIWRRDISMNVRAEELLSGCSFVVPTKVKSYMLSCQPQQCFYSGFNTFEESKEENLDLYSTKTKKTGVNLIKLICTGHRPKVDGKQIFWNHVFFDILDGPSLSDL